MRTMAGEPPDYTGLDSIDTRSAMKTSATSLSNRATAMDTECGSVATDLSNASQYASVLSAQLRDTSCDSTTVQATLVNLEGCLLNIRDIYPNAAETPYQSVEYMLGVVPDLDDPGIGGYVRDDMLTEAEALNADLTAISDCMTLCRNSCGSIITAMTTLSTDVDRLGALDTNGMLAELDAAEQQINAYKDLLGAQADTWLAMIDQMRNALQSSNDPATRADIANSARIISTDIREKALTLNYDINKYVQDTSITVKRDLNDAQAMLYDTGIAAQQLSGTLAAYSTAVGSTQVSMREAIALNQSIRAGIAKLADDLRIFSESEAFMQLVDVIENNPDGLAEYLASPINIQNEIVYEIGDYGSAMSPYYIMLALFVGSLLAATMIKVQVRSADLSGLRPMTRYFGRFLLFFFIGMAQALVTALGCLYYVGIQCLHPGLFILACCICSLNFAMMNFALVYALDNIGMGAAVIIMVIQVAGSGGSYPVDVLPTVYKILYPFMPFHYGMDMIRETIGGMYDGIYLRCAAILLGMCVLFTVFGLLLYYPAKGINGLIARSKEATGLM